MTDAELDAIEARTRSLYIVDGHVAPVGADLLALVAEVRRLRKRRFTVAAPSCGCDVEVRFMECGAGIEASVSVRRPCDTHGACSIDRRLGGR